MDTLVRPKLKDAYLDSLLHTQGFVVLKNFIPTSVIAQLLELTQANLNKSETTDKVFWNSVWNLDLKEAKIFSNQLFKALQPYLGMHLTNYEVKSISAMVKLPGDETECLPHRDFSILNEQKYLYYNCWCPLVDITYAMGALYVLPKSHLILNEVRPFLTEWKYHQFVQEVIKLSEPVYPQKGDLVIYADRTVHGSFANTTNNYRPVLHFGALPEQAEYCFYQLDNLKVRSSIVSSEFYINQQFNQPNYPHQFKDYANYSSKFANAKSFVDAFKS